VVKSLGEVPFVREVGVVFKSGVDVKMVTPAGKFDTVVSHFANFREEVGEREVGPLASE